MTWPTFRFWFIIACTLANIVLCVASVRLNHEAQAILREANAYVKLCHPGEATDIVFVQQERP